MSCSHLLHGARWLRVCLFLGFCVPLGTGAAFFLRVRPLVPFGGCLLLEMFFFLVAACLPASGGLSALPFGNFAWQCGFFCAILFSLHSVGSWGCKLYLAGLDAHSLRSPSVLILLVLADLDGLAIIRGYLLSNKISFDDLSENVIYCIGISPDNGPPSSPRGLRSPHFHHCWTG